MPAIMTKERIKYVVFQTGFLGVGVISINSSLKRARESMKHAAEETYIPSDESDVYW